MTDNSGGDVKAASGTLMLEGIILILLGLVAIVVPGFFTLAIETLIGALFLVGGAIRLWRCLRNGADTSRVWHVVASLAAIVAGVLLLANPFQGAVALTIIVVALFLTEGATKLAAAFRVRPGNGWVWLLVSGAVDIVLAVLLWAGLPGTAAWAIGLMVGISLLFGGWTAVMIASGLRRMAREA